MAGFLSNLGFAVLTVFLSTVILVVVVSPPRLEPTAPHIQTRDGTRHLSYEVVGNSKQPNCIIWLHGILSSRNEVLALNKGVLDELDAYVVSFDRPGYGESSMLRGRTYESEVEDIEDLAGALGVNKFYLAAVSGGGPYALAAAALIPHRLRGLLLLSAAGSPGVSSAPVVAKEQTEKHPYLHRALQHPWLVASAQKLVETYVGGRALYTLWLHDVAAGIIARFSEVDKRCIMKQHRSPYFLKVIPEATKQGTATALIQDLLLIVQPWSFNVSSIPEVVQAATHIWHGTEDLQVHHQHAENYKKLLPKASVRIIENGGHMAYWACDTENQRQAFEQLLHLGLPR